MDSNTQVLTTEAGSRVVRLARCAHRLLGGQLRPPGFVCAELARLAVVRHGIGPMLFLVAEARTERSDPQALDILAREYDRNARRQCEAQLALLQIAQTMYRSAIEWRTVGGWAEAALLYPDPNWRLAAEIDILVAPGAARAAARALRNTGWRDARPAGFAALMPGRAGSRPCFAALIGPAAQRLNIHERVLSAECAIGRVFDVDFSPRRSADAGDIPGPRAAHPLALARLLRGANRRWAQLKWLIDLAALFALLDAAAFEALFESVSEAGVNRSATASLLLYRTVFGSSIEAPVARWLDEQCVTAKIEARVQLHLAALMDSGLPGAAGTPDEPAKHSGPLGAMRDAFQQVRVTAARARAAALRHTGLGS